MLVYIFLQFRFIQHMMFSVRQGKKRCGTKWNETEKKEGRRKIRRKRWKRDTCSSSGYTMCTRQPYDYIHLTKCCAHFKNNPNWNREPIESSWTRASLSLLLCLSSHLTVETSVQKMPCGPSKPLFYIIKVVNHSHTNTRAHTSNEKEMKNEGIRFLLFPSPHRLSLLSSFNTSGTNNNINNKNRATERMIFMKKKANKL